MNETSTTAISPAAAGGRLKYADPRSLPSFPSSGLPEKGAAAGAAASLGWSNQKPVELWKPDPSSASSAAAVLAKDYKMAPMWEPDSSSAGRKAALLATGSASAALKNRPEQPAPKKASGPHATWGNSAATQAFHANRPAQAPLSNGPASDHNRKLVHGNTAANSAFHTNRLSMRQAQADTTAPEVSAGDRSLLAAQGAMASSRPRSNSNPSASSPQQPSNINGASSSGALTGAAMAHRASTVRNPNAASPVGGAVPVTTMTRNMFTSRPAVAPEISEKEYNDKIHNDAVAMAKKMYAHQQRMTDQTTDSTASPGTGSGQFVNLQDAAYKQAQERLAKLHDERYKNLEYQEYYGGGQQSQAPNRRRSMMNKLRRKTSNDSDSDDFDDHEESQKIRQQMSMFSSKVSQIDNAKRQKDRDAVLAAAQRNVKARLQGMDEKVYNETGRANPGMMTDWEAKAQAAAQSRYDADHQNSTKGKVDVGGGRFMSPEEVNAIAASKVQPVLDDINQKADEDRERRLAQKMEEESKRDEEKRRKEREREVAQLHQQSKDEEKQQLKAQREKEKAEEKERKERERFEKAEAKRLAKEEKSRSKHGDSAADNTETHDVVPDHTAPATTTIVTGGDADDHTRNNADSSSPNSPSSPTSPTKSKVRGWIKNRFSRGKSVSDGDGKRRSFFGGAALRDQEANNSTTSLDNRNSSMRDVAMAGKAPATEEDGAADRGRATRDSRGVSPVSTPGEEFCDPLSGTEAVEQPTPMTPPKPIADPMVRTSVSPSRDSRFREEIS